MTNKRLLTATLTAIFTITLNGVVRSSMIHVGEYNNQDYYIDEDSCYIIGNTNNYRFYLASSEIDTKRNPRILKIQTNREKNQYTIQSAIIFQDNFKDSEVPVQSTRQLDNSDVMKEVINILDSKNDEVSKSNG